MTYQFTSNQLTKLMGWAIDSFVEYIDKHGKDTETAQACAIREVFDALSAERELLEDGVKLDPSHTMVTPIAELLRKRLATIQQRIEYSKQYQYAIEQESYSHAREVEHWEASGERRALQCEQLFLAGLLDQMQAEVTA